VAGSHRAAPWSIIATRIADFQRRDKRVLPFSGKPAVPLTKRYLVQRISRSHRQSRLTGTFYHRRRFRNIGMLPCGTRTSCW